MNTFLAINRWTAKRAGLLLCAVGFLGAEAAHAQTYVFTTVAGYAGQGSADGTGRGALFLHPQAVAVDGAGNVYVADTGHNTIRVVTPGGVSSTLAGRAGVSGAADGAGTNALFNQPFGLALDAATNIYVTDSGNNTIREITRAGQVATIAGSAGLIGSNNATGTGARFFHPMGLAVDSATNLYVADYGNHLIRKITPSRAVTTLAGLAGVFGSANGTGTAAQFYNPEALALDAAWNVYVADTGNAAIRKITSTGVVTTFAARLVPSAPPMESGSHALFFQPSGIVMSSSSNLYVSDFFNNTIRQITPAAAVTTLAGLPGSAGSADGSNSLAQFWGPQGLAADKSGNVYVADTANSAIRVMTPAGVVTTLAGSPSDGSANGPEASARFYAPRNVAVDSATNLYVADTQNSVIRKITPAGIVSVLAGTTGVFGSEDGPSAGALFAGPQGVAVDEAGNVYVSDTGNCTIRKITSSGVVSTLAGLAGNPGNADGAGTAAQFNGPGGMALDSANNIYVADTLNHTIRKITPQGVSSTLAGLAGAFGSYDGTNSSARFHFPTGLAVDSAGNIYVADRVNNTIRRVTPAGAVTTLAGTPGAWGSADGVNGAALFFGPTGISVDNSGNLLVVDSGNDTLRKVAPVGGNWVVSTVSGLPDVSGSSGSGATGAEFYYPAGVAVGANGYVYVADAGNNTIRARGIPPSVTIAPANLGLALGGSVTFNVTASGNAPLSYQWQFDGTNLPGATLASLLVTNFAKPQAGSYTVVVTNTYGSVTSAPALLLLQSSPPAIVTQPASQSGVLGSNAILTVAVSGPGPFSFQWLSNGVALSNYITTVAGNGNTGSSGDGAPATNATLYPAGVAVDAFGNIFVADSINDRVRRIAANGLITTVAGTGATGYAGDGGPAASASLFGPSAVAVDAAGDVFVADTGNDCIREVGTNGIINTVAGNGSAGFAGDGAAATNASLSSPVGVAVDTFGNIYIADEFNNCIRQVGPGGIINTVAGNGANGYFGDGGAATSASLSSPAGVAVDLAGNLYIADGGNRRIRKVDANGIITTVAGSGGSGFFGDGGPATNALMELPAGVAVDPLGRVLIADSSNHRIRVVDTNGIITTLAGNGAFGFAGDGGAPANAELSDVSGVATDIGGNAIIADAGNNRVREAFNFQEPTLALWDLNTADAGGYDVVIISPGGITTSAVAQLTFAGPTLGVTRSGSTLVFSWSGVWILQTAANLSGPWTDLPTATGPYTNQIGRQPAAFFRLR